MSIFASYTDRSTKRTHLLSHRRGIMESNSFIQRLKMVQIKIQFLRLIQEIVRTSFLHLSKIDFLSLVLAYGCSIWESIWGINKVSWNRDSLQAETVVKSIIFDFCNWGGNHNWSQPTASIKCAPANRSNWTGNCDWYQTTTVLEPPIPNFGDWVWDYDGS